MSEFCGSNSVVECHLAKVDVEGSNPFSRSRTGWKTGRLRNDPQPVFSLTSPPPPLGRARRVSGGLAGVSIEPIARLLGVTKGSFYWHFADRDALVAAALAHWEKSYTENVIDALEELPDPRERLARHIGRGLVGGRSDCIHIALATA